MIIFIVPHLLWNLKLILVPRAQLPQLRTMLKKKIDMGILKPLGVPTLISGSLYLKRTGR